MLGVERIDCRDEQDILFAGRLAAFGNIEFLTREAPQPSSLHELPHFKRAYDLIMRELIELKTIYDSEEERVTKDLYWRSYIKKSILSLGKELEDSSAAD